MMNLSEDDYLILCRLTGCRREVFPAVKPTEAPEEVPPTPEPPPIEIVA